MKITGIVITKNEEKNIKKCINSLKSVSDEVIVVDSESTDKTVETAKQCGAIVINNKFIGYKEQRNFAQSKAKYDWILVLDADEEFSDKAIKQIREIQESDSALISAYSFPRNLFFLKSKFSGTLLTCERKTRFYNKQKCSWNGGNVHEKLIVDGKSKKLTGFINHYMNDSIEDYNRKLMNYACIDAKFKFKKGKRTGLMKIFGIIVINFLKQYIFKFRFVHGAKGLVLTWVLTNYSIAKYIKLYELQSKNKEN